MITTRRSETNSISAFGSDSSRGGVALLERKEPVSYKEYVAPETTNESAEVARARMQENLAKLLNYDRYSEQVQDSAPVAVEAEVAETVETKASATETIQESKVSEDDIRPTSTTMQFGEGEIDNLRMEMKREAEQSSTSKYKLNAKGKVVVILYALVLTVVMALIAINSGVLAKLSSTELVGVEEMNAKVQTLSELESEIESLSSSEHIESQAIELGMIK